jgi:hypothetical protein
MMRVFAVATADTATVLDLIVIDPATGEVAFGTGAAEDLFDELAPIDTEDLTVDQVLERIDGWSNDLLDIAEIPYEEPVGQVASLAGLARAEFNKKHHRGKGGLFAHADAPDTPSAAAVKAKAEGDSGGVEEVKPSQAVAIRGHKGYVPGALRGALREAPPPAPAPAVVNKARERLRNAERMHGSDRSKWSKKDQAAAGKLDAIIAADKAAQNARSAKLHEQVGHMTEAVKTAQGRLNPDAGLKPTKATPPGDHASHLEGLESREDAQKYLAGVKGASLAALAKHYSVPSDTTADQKRTMIMDASVGAKLDSRAIRGNATLEYGPPPVPKKRPKTVDAALESGEHDALNGFSKRSLVAAVRRRKLAVGDPNKLTVDELAAVLSDSHVQGQPAAGNLPNIREVQRQARDLGIDMSDLRTKQEILDRIEHVKANRPKSHTSKMNAHSLSVGDQIEENGETLHIRGTKRDIVGGQPVIVLETVDSDGRRKRLIKNLNEPVPRVVGGRTGGAGTFTLEPLEADSVFGETAADVVDLIAGWEFALSGADLEDFKSKHPRGVGGRFGHSTALFNMLKAKAAKAGNRTGDDAIDFDGAGSDIPDGQYYNRSFDWSQRDRDVTRRGNQEHLLDITGPSQGEVEYDENDEVVSEDWEEKTARLHLSDGDMRSLAAFVGTELLRRELQTQPFEGNDPRAPYMVALMDLQPRTWHPEDPGYDEHFSIYPKEGNAGWHLSALGDDGDEVNFDMTNDEMDALYGQFASYLLTPRGMEAEAQQTAAALFQADLLDYAEAFAQWALTEFDISTMPEHLQRYWTEGEGAAKVRWGTRGSFRRARRLLLKEGVPLRMVNGTVANLYKRATGKHPGPHGRRRNLTGPGRMAAMGTRIMLPMQTACAMCGNDQMMVDLGDDETTAAPDLDAPSPSMGWRGPLAPVDVKTGDRREFTAEALATRRLPLPFRWQEEQKSGHDGAVVVGALTGYSVLSDPYTMPNGTVLPPGTIMGEGYFLDPEKIPQAEKAMYLVEHGLIGPSVDLEPDMDVSFTDEAGNTFNPHTCAMDGSCPTKPTALITNATVAGATLVPITAFAEARAPQLYTRTARDDMAVMGLMRPSCGCSDQVAAVRANGWDDLPFADRDVEWDKGAAVGRLVEWASDGDQLDLDKYGRAFLWHDDPADAQGAFKLPIADVIDGELTIVPRAVFAVAARLNQTDIPATAKQDVRDVLDDLYDQMADEFDDDSLQAPWDASTSNEMALASDGCGCAEKWARSLAGDGSQTAAAVFAGLDPYPADAFRVKAKGLTPMTLDDRPDEPFTRVYGHIGSWSSCNRGHRGVCVPPPRSRSGYKEFHLGELRTTEGPIKAGKIVMGEGHADVNGTPRVVRAFYDATSKEFAYGRVVDDEFGPFFSGVLAPDVTAVDATRFMMSPPSGHWTNFELMAILAVNVPGHVVPRAHIIDGQMANMVAAGQWFDEPADDLGQIAAELDALAWADESAALVGAFE